jgi:hypothetical protein
LRKDTFIEVLLTMMKFVHGIGHTAGYVAGVRDGRTDGYNDGYQKGYDKASLEVSYNEEARRRANVDGD